LIYAAFTVWLFLALFAGRGVYALWTRLVRPTWVNWALLPGTIVSEMAYIFGCLVTGGEIRRASLMPGGSARGRASGSAAPGTQMTPRWKTVGPTVASLISVLICAAALVAAVALVGEPVMEAFRESGGMWKAESLPTELPRNWNGFWEQAVTHVWMLRRICETWGGLDWLNWRVPLFVYLTVCLSVRLAPVGRPLRPTLAAVVGVAAGVAVAGLISERSARFMEQRVWHPLAYVWTTLLAVLVGTLVLHGFVAVIRARAGEKGHGRSVRLADGD